MGTTDNIRNGVKMSIPYIAVDLDGTLARYEEWGGTLVIGEPVMPMVRRVKGWLKEGWKVKIMTARITKVKGQPFNRKETVKAIEDWCVKHIGQKLEVTSEKDYYMVQLWDDRAIQVITNEGITLAEKHLPKLKHYERRMELPKPQQKRVIT